MKTALCLWWAGVDSNHRTRERTDLQSVAFNHSATYPLTTSPRSWLRSRGIPECFHFWDWSRPSELNRQPSDYKSDALPVELERQPFGRTCVRGEDYQRCECVSSVRGQLVSNSVRLGATPNNTMPYDPSGFSFQMPSGLYHLRLMRFYGTLLRLEVLWLWCKHQ